VIKPNTPTSTHCQRVISSYDTCSSF
jgi:hypothetical protein